jgi:branched-chain amino acid aminotransferase
VDGKVTSPVRNVLDGMTRGTVGELCDEAGIPFALATIPPSELRESDEVFISTTSGGILSVSKIDGKPVGSGVPGPIWRKLRDSYWRKRLDGWHGTKVS